MSEQRINKRDSNGVKKYCFEMLPPLTGNSGDSNYIFKNGQKYFVSILGLDLTNDADYEHNIENLVYDPDTFNQKMEEVLCSWTKGNKITVTKFELCDLNDYNYAWIVINWK